ncbi:glucose-6-phosphate dehydrogenase [Labrenzia sp. DG1229]|uniref:glucose-6-phosphate dehydrogenase n=1 Tax=Labrenzia sp. DG1229 TaxID=681847 RepID=UPI000491B622|nr:glucose-6-phosphate dehydrogenase [Labrenzia sp. DG1229]
MTNRTIPVRDFDCLIFGATGDLCRRKLIPALYHRLHAGQLDAMIECGGRIIGTSRSDMTTSQFQEFAKSAIEEALPTTEIDSGTLKTFLSLLQYQLTDAFSSEGWDELANLVKADPAANDRVRVLYLAVAPVIFAPIVEKIESNGLVSKCSRIVVEKPLGSDLESAQELNKTIGNVFSEAQIFRIDHYLGKETVQNLLTLRFSNILFERNWGNSAIDHVQITVAEALGVGARGNYYDTSGAMRDMVQNHLLQLLCLVAMEPPARFDADAVRDEKLKVLKALKPLVGKDVARATVRGQYSAGALGSRVLPAYSHEIDAESSDTETFVAMKAEVSNFRWAGIPFYLRTGKRLATRMSEIVIQFKPLSHDIFGRHPEDTPGNKLVLRLQPEEGVKQFVLIKEPGPGGMRFTEVPLDMSFAAAFDVRHADAYERLIMDVVRGDQTLFMRGDEVEQAWRWIDPVLTAWTASSQKPESYPAGSSGPPSSFELITRDNRSWQPIDGLL